MRRQGKKNASAEPVHRAAGTRSFTSGHQRHRHVVVTMSGKRRNIRNSTSRRRGVRMPAAHRTAHIAVRSVTVQRFSSEITELRALGFAEGLPIDVIDPPSGVFLRLESGRVGVAVEFCAEDTPRYAVKPLLGDTGGGRSMATDVWSDIVRDIHRRAPPSGDE
jgi:hypothetical protein